MTPGNVLTVLSLFGSLQALVLGLAILAGRDGKAGSAVGAERPTRIALGSLVLVFGAAVAVIALDHSGWIDDSFLLHWIETTLTFLFPLFLLYARLLIGRTTKPGWFAVHGAPLVSWLVASLPTALTGSGVPWWPPILGIVLYQVAYTSRVAWLAFVEARRPLPGLGLLRLLVIGLAVVHLAQGVRFSLPDVAILEDVVPVVSTGLLYLVVYRALAGSDLLHPGPPPYADSGLAPADAAEEGRRLERLLEDERLFADADLDLEGLADHMGVSRTRLSQIVNQGLGTSFHDLVNRHRVAEAERLLCDRALDHVTIQAIGERAGFSSRSVFYDAFRQRTGSTPGRYRQSSRAERRKGEKAEGLEG